MPAFVAVIKLAWISGVVLLNVRDRFVNQTQRNFGRHGFAARIPGGDRKRTLVARLVLLPIGFHVDREKLLHWRNDHLLSIYEQLRITHHSRAEVDIRNVFLLDWQLDQPGRSGDVHQFVTVEILAFDTK